MFYSGFISSECSRRIINKTTFSHLTVVLSWKKCFVDIFDHLFDMQQVKRRVTFKLKSRFYQSDSFINFFNKLSTAESKMIRC